MADNAEQLRQANLAKLPFWSGTKSDTFTAEQWVERISRSRHSGGWDHALTMTYVFNALRGDALSWFDALKRTGVNRNNWDDFKTAFLKAYSTTRTPRTTTVHLADLQQGATENVVQYYSRVIRAIDDLEMLIPNGRFPRPDPLFGAAFTGVNAFNNIALADRQAEADALISHGATSAFNHMALNLFVSNLRPFLRDKLLENRPDSLTDAFDTAVALERLQTDPRRATAGVNAVDSDPPSTDDNASKTDTPEDSAVIDAEIDALNLKLRSLQHRRQGAAPRNQPRPSGSTGFSNPPPSSNGRPPRNQQQQQRRARPEDKCRYCKKSGHFQKECFSRRRDNAPMVGADGQPYRKNSVFPLDDQVVSFQQQQQQLQNPLNAPFSAYPFMTPQPDFQ